MRRMSFLATLQDQAYAAPRSPFKPRAEPPSLLIFTYHITTHNLFLHNKLIKYFTRLDPLNKISATPYFSSRRKLTELSMHECHKKSVSLKRKMKIKRILFCFHLTPFQTKKNSQLIYAELSPLLKHNDYPRMYIRPYFTKKLFSICSK